MARMEGFPEGTHSIRGIDQTLLDDIELGRYEVDCPDPDAMALAERTAQIDDPLDHDIGTAGLSEDDAVAHMASLFPQAVRALVDSSAFRGLGSLGYSAECAALFYTTPSGDTWTWDVASPDGRWHRVARCARWDGTVSA